jgi:hypothetical protein
MSTRPAASRCREGGGGPTLARHWVGQLEFSGVLYGLMDARAVSQYYQQAPERMPRRWDQALSRHRNTVIHHGYVCY